MIFTLVRRSSGKFIFASTVVKYLADLDYNPMEQLNYVMGVSPTCSNDSFRAFQDLDALCFNILMNRRRIPRTLVYILGYILATDGCLTLAQLDKLCSL
ncbi:hypothetical protein BDQ17DRAFT_1371088, partial [Cyathus striatus]